MWHIFSLSLSLSLSAKKCVCLLLFLQDANCTTHERHARAATLDPNFDFMCNEINSGFFCLSCKTLVICVDGIANLEDCGAEHTCDDLLDFGGGVCYPDSAKCTCSSKKELLPDQYNNRAYLDCQAGDLYPKTVEFCKKNMIFNGDTLMCEYPTDYVECTKAGVFSNPNDCTEYYKCMPVAIGLIQYTFSCTCGLLFNDETKECEDPCYFQPEVFTCQEEGRFADLYDCHKYHECIYLLDGSGYLKFDYTCPQQSFWEPDVEYGSGSCKISKGYDVECNNRQMPVCSVPVGRNCTLTPDIYPGRSTRFFIILFYFLGDI